MNVLLIGSGGREHALAFKLRQSPLLSRLFIAPGNAGTQDLGKNVQLDVTDHAAVTAFCHAHRIDLVVVGPEAPLVSGLSDELERAGLDVFGPSRAAARLEGSKHFTKQLCDEMNIPTAEYAHFSALEPALEYLERRGVPIVIKADGLAAGKGVTVAMEMQEAEDALRACFSGAMGTAGAEVVIEEFLEGEELSFFAVCDGSDFVSLASAQDHKRAFDGDRGPNTGGMGAYSPAPAMTAELARQIETDIIAPTLAGMKGRGTPFKGVLYAGLVLTRSGPKLIEYNVRFGDPECQVLMMRLKSDLLDLLQAAARGRLCDVKPEWCDETALCVVMAARGYPGKYQGGSEIRGLEQAGGENVEIFHAGTSKKNGAIIASGGRVLNICAMGRNAKEAQEHAYEAVGKIDWPDGFCRSDIGWRAIEREQA